MGSHGSSSLLFVCGVCDEGDGVPLCEVLTGLIVVLPSNCCCGDFSAFS